MGFFKDFKDDFSQAVNELMPADDNLETSTNEDDVEVNTLEGEVDVETELSKLDGLLEQVTKQEAEKVAAARSAAEMAARNASAPTERAAVPVPASVPEPERNETVSNITKATQEERKMADNTTAPVTNNQSAPVSDEVSVITEGTIIKGDIVSNGSLDVRGQEERKMADNTTAPVTNNQSAPVSDEVSVITEGTIIKGDIVSNGSLDVRGQVEGNVGCNGKLVVTGVVNGNSSASEFFADAAKIEGEVVSTGTIKIGLGSVIIGNVTSTSAVIAGAIKGDIDVQGPVVVDTSAVVMGNIKSRSVQINNGAVIEGFCSQCYSDVDVQSLFNGNAQKGNE